MTYANNRVTLPLISIERPKAASNVDAGMLQVADGSHDVGVGHTFGRIIVLIDGQNASKVWMLPVQSEKIGCISAIST